MKHFTFGLIIIAVIAAQIGCGAGAIAIEEKVGDELSAIDGRTQSVLGIVEISAKILHYTSELHKAGVDKEVIETIRHALLTVHQIAEEEHKKHVR